MSLQGLKIIFKWVIEWGNEKSFLPFDALSNVFSNVSWCFTDFLLWQFLLCLPAFWMWKTIFLSEWWANTLNPGPNAQKAFANMLSTVTTVCIYICMHTKGRWSFQNTRRCLGAHIFSDVFGKCVNSLSRANGKPDSTKAGPQSLGASWYVAGTSPGFTAFSKSWVDGYCQDGSIQAYLCFRIELFRVTLPSTVEWSCRNDREDTEKALLHPMVARSSSYHCLKRLDWGWTEFSSWLWKTHCSLPKVYTSLAFPNSTKTITSIWLTGCCRSVWGHRPGAGMGQQLSGKLSHTLLGLSILLIIAFSGTDTSISINMPKMCNIYSILYRLPK